MGGKAWVQGPMGAPALAHYSLLLRSETDCKAVLFFSSAAFCCCETEQERDTKDSCHPEVTPTATGQELGSWPPWEKAVTMAEGIGVAEPSAGEIRLQPQASPLRARGLPVRVWAAPWRGQGWRNTGQEMNEKGRGHHILTTLSPSPRPSLPSHLLLDLGTVGEGVFTAVVDSHIAGWEGGVKRVKGGPGGAGGDTPVCRHPSPPGHTVSETVPPAQTSQTSPRPSPLLPPPPSLKQEAK